MGVAAYGCRNDYGVSGSISWLISGSVAITKYGNQYNPNIGYGVTNSMSLRTKAGAGCRPK